MRWVLVTLIYVFVQVSYADNLPNGNSSAEGVAADMAIAFIESNEDLWRNVVLKDNNEKYTEFINQIATEMKEQANLPLEQKSGPKEIGVVFKMGKLSKNGPNSYAYAVKNLDEIGFVDVGVISYDGKKSLNRTFVARKGDTWYALPRPDLFPLLTAGLNEEERIKEAVYNKK